MKNKLNHLKELRKYANIKTAKEAAQLLKVSAGMVYQMEEGLKKPSVKLAIAMSKVYKCSLEDIFLPFNTTNSNKSKKIACN